MTDFVLNLNCSCETVLRLTTTALERQGLRVVRDFDLRDALNTGGLPCPCPYHGTEECTCNYVVLSVYQAVGLGQPLPPPNQIVIHRYQGNTWLSLPAAGTRSESQDTDIDSRLLRALAEVVNEVAARA